MLYTYKAKITAVYDGDTVTALVDLGFKVNFTMKLRLLGIDTPELRGEEREEGLKVRDYVRELILNKDVIIKTYRDKQGKYGRYLAEIFMEEDSTISLNQSLLDKGMATPYPK
jgi:micrococcal nuclease